MVDTARSSYPPDMTRAADFPNMGNLETMANDVLDRLKRYAPRRAGLLRALGAGGRVRPRLEAQALVIRRCFAVLAIRDLPPRPAGDASRPPSGRGGRPCRKRSTFRPRPTPHRTAPTSMKDGAVSQPPPLVVLFDPASLTPDDHEAALRSGGYRIARASTDGEAVAALAHDGPAALVVVEGRSGPSDEGRVCHAARDRGIPVLGLLDHEGDAPSLRDRVEGYDGWTHFACPPNFLVARLGQILNGQAADRPAKPEPIPIDVRLLAMIVHDLRNPLNVIGLTLRVIEQMPAATRAAIQEDLTFLKDNAGQIEKSLGLLSDLCRLGDLGPPGPMEFNPRRLVEEILEEKAHRGNDKAYPATFVSEPGTPESVVLDPMHARLAILAALINAAAVTDRPLTVRSSGADGRWTLAIDVDRPPPATVHPEQARAERFERLIGSTSERKGLDLALAAWIADQSGGKVRLDIEPGRRSTIVLDWPVKPA